MRGKFIKVLIFGLSGIAVLLGLGIWQLERLAWKEGVIATLGQRLNANPVLLAAEFDRVTDKYRRVAIDGRYLPGEAHMLTSVKFVGPGYLVIAPYETDDGRKVLIDRGFIPQPDKDLARDIPAVPVTGALLWPDEIDGFTPDPDLKANIWFGRDVDKLAAQFGTEPVLIVAESNPGPAPIAQPLTVNIKNDHLGYAVTWFGLALVWAVMTGVALLRLHRTGET
jgi:surfeit locus 1 family protein